LAPHRYRAPVASRPIDQAIGAPRSTYFNSGARWRPDKAVDSCSTCGLKNLDCWPGNFFTAMSVIKAKSARRATLGAVRCRLRGRSKLSFDARLEPRFPLAGAFCCGRSSVLRAGPAKASSSLCRRSQHEVFEDEFAIARSQRGAARTAGKLPPTVRFWFSLHFHDVVERLTGRAGKAVEAGVSAIRHIDLCSLLTPKRRMMTT
jgi:hypothetical protein